MSLDGAAKKPSGVLHNLPPSIGKSKVDNEFRRDSCCNFGKNPLFYGVGYSRIVEGGRILASLLVFLSALFLCASAVQADERGSLDSLRRELSEIERQLLQGTFRETDLLTEIDARERQIALQTELIHAQRVERRRLGDTLRFFEKSLEQGSDLVQGLSLKQDEVEQRRSAVQSALVRHWNAQRRLSRWGTLEFLLGARSFNELSRRRQILNNLHRFEQKYLAQLTSQSLELGSLRGEIETQADYLHGKYLQVDQTRSDILETERALRSEQKKLKQQQALFTVDLETVRNDRTFLQKRLHETQEALRQIEEMVRATRDTSLTAAPVPGKPLTPLKGLLPWPAQGEVLAAFGPQKQHGSERPVNNPGVDIAASATEEVSCVADGRVAICTWLRGFGNVIIVEHPGDFFTVYAHLQQLNVQGGQTVTSGAHLGTPALDNISGKYRIHFEIWEGKQKQNPLVWLAKR
jgi:septal ring factor EnvC (AmiA/AmiB activator)